MLLFKLGSFFFKIAVYIARFFNQKAKLAILGRNEVFQVLNEFNKANKDSKIAWFHCASYGEFEQGRPIIEAYRKSFPSNKIVLTFFSPSGYEAWKGYKGADLVTYLPFDSKKNAHTFIQTLTPEKVFFVKYEFWPNYLEQLKNTGTSTYLVSGIFREGQIFFKGSFGKKILGTFTHFFVQDSNSKQLLTKIGLTNCSVSGDSRVDRVIQNSKTEFKNERIETFCKNKKVIIAGSTWSKDEDQLIQYIRNNDDWKLVLVPHELKESKLNNLYNKLSGISYCSYSDTTKSDVLNSKILVLDTMGMLSKVYRFGTICYVGGGFGKGIHNVLEPIIYKKPVIIGPNFKKFKEAKDLINLGAITSVSDGQELKSAIKLFSKEKARKKVEASINRYIDDNQGSVKKIMDFITK